MNTSCLLGETCVGVPSVRVCGAVVPDMLFLSEPRTGSQPNVIKL